MLSQLGEYKTDDGRYLLQELSGESWYYDPEGDWTISTLVTKSDGESPPKTEVTMRQKMRAPRYLVNAAFLPFEPEQFVDEAWEEADDQLCVVRQIAALTHRVIRNGTKWA